MNSRESPALCVAEPFRIFFPLGLLLGAIGVVLWPLFVWHGIDFYPASAHARLMIEGLMGSFIIGFLGTAGPRLLYTHPFAGIEISMLFAIELLSASLHFAQNQFAGDTVFLVLLLSFLGMMGTRARTAQDFPPPHFVLVFLGFLSAIIGIFLIA